MVYIMTEKYLKQSFQLQPTASRGCNKILTINTKLCFYLILALATIQSLSFAHHYICLLHHRHTSLLFLCLMTIHVKCKWKETRGDLGWGGGTSVWGCEAYWTVGIGLTAELGDECSVFITAWNCSVSKYACIKIISLLITKVCRIWLHDNRPLKIKRKGLVTKRTWPI